MILIQTPSINVRYPQTTSSYNPKHYRKWLTLEPYDPGYMVPKTLFPPVMIIIIVND